MPIGRTVAIPAEIRRYFAPVSQRPQHLSTFATPSWFDEANPIHKFAEAHLRSALSRAGSCVFHHWALLGRLTRFSGCRRRYLGAGASRCHQRADL